MTYKAKYIGPETIFTHPGITRIGGQPYTFITNTYTQLDNETDYNFFKKKSGSFAVLNDVITEATAAEAIIENKPIEAPKPKPKPREKVK
ncbi:MAG: hypothetical protein WC319_04790 [Candidatus Paceibacterota bacterium]|jgi:hypothetical protein